MFIMADQIKAEAGNNEVFLVGHEETDSHSLSQAKKSPSQEGHTSPFVDINKRVLTRHTLHGKKSETIKELLDNYSVKHFMRIIMELAAIQLHEEF